MKEEQFSNYATESMAMRIIGNGFMKKKQFFFLGKFLNSNKISHWRLSKPHDTAGHFNTVLGEIKSQSINCRARIKFVPQGTI